MSGETWRCNSCGAVYSEPGPEDPWGPHRCAPQENPYYQPDPAAPDFDPREFVMVENPRDETPWPDMGPDPDHPATPRPSGIRAEGKGRTLVQED